jgi:MFS family permease
VDADDNPTHSAGGPPFTERVRDLPRNVWAVTATSFLTDASTETITGLLPFYLAETLGASPAAIGLIEGIAEATASLVKLASGWLSDRLGRRKPLAVFGYALSTGSKAMLLAAVTWPAVLVARFLERGGKGIRTAPRDALLADSIQPESRGVAFGLHRAGDTAGAVVGLSVALIVVVTLEAAGAPLALPTFRAAVLISLIPAAAAVLILAAFAREVRSTSAPRGQASSIREVLAEPRFRGFLLAVLFFSLGNSSDAFLLLRAGSLGLDIPRALLMMIVLNIVYAAFATPVGSLSDRVGRKTVLIAGWGLYAAVYLLLGLADAGWQVWPIVVAYGLYYAATEGVGKAFIADLVPSERRGRGYGAYHAAIGMAALPASLMGGLAWQAVGPSGPFLLGAVLAVVGLFLLWRVPARAVVGDGAA